MASCVACGAELEPPVRVPHTVYVKTLYRCKRRREFDQSRHPGLGIPRWDCQSVPGHSCCGANECGRRFRWSVRPLERKKAPLSDPC